MMRAMNCCRDGFVFEWAKALLGAAVMMMTAAGCGTPPAKEETSAIRPPRAFWRGDGVAGSPRIVINLSEQRLRYYKGGELVGETPVATGTSSHPTPSGSFRVTEKDLHHRSSWYGDYVYADGTVARSDVDVRKDARPPGSRYLGANMRYFMRINGPVGMHEGFLPGYPASHGCIRLPTQMAAILFRETPRGTPVQVTGRASAASYEAPIYVGQDVLGTTPAPTVASSSASAKPAQEETRKARAAGRQDRETRAAKPAKKKKQEAPPRGVTQYYTPAL